VCPNNYKEEKIMSLKRMLTPKHNEMKNIQLRTSEVHSCGGEQKKPMAAIIQ
jgi:hypothetical protein